MAIKARIVYWFVATVISVTDKQHLIKIIVSNDHERSWKVHFWIFLVFLTFIFIQRNMKVHYVTNSGCYEVTYVQASTIVMLVYRKCPPIYLQIIYCQLIIKVFIHILFRCVYLHIYRTWPVKSRVFFTHFTFFSFSLFVKLLKSHVFLWTSYIIYTNIILRPRLTQIIQWSSCKIQVWSSKLWCLLIRVHFMTFVYMDFELQRFTIVFFSGALQVVVLQTTYYDSLSLSNDVTLFQVLKGQLFKLLEQSNELIFQCKTSDIHSDLTKRAASRV